MLSWPIKGMVICSSRNQYAWLVMNSGSPVHQPGKFAPRFTLWSYFNPIYVPLPHIHSLHIKYKLIFKLLLFNHFLTLKYTLKYTKIHFLIWLLLWILSGLPQWFSSVLFCRSVVSDSLLPHELQHARPPCPSPTPGVHPNPCPLSRWCHPTISSSVVPFSFVAQMVKKLPAMQET